MGFRKLLLKFAFVWMASSIVSTWTVQAQTTAGAISGVVTDASGAVVANAEVKATSEGTGRTWSTTSGAAGEVQVEELPPGLYTVEVSAAGFEKFSMEKVGVAGGAIFNLPVKLAVQSARKVVIVN